MSSAPDGPPGWLARVRRAVEEHPPPGPFLRTFWRSPLRGPWITAVFGLVLLVGVTILFVTGLLSYAAYNPDLAGNDTKSGTGLFGFYLFDWPTQPYWLYRVNQGAHVTLGLVLIPVLLGKLWSVIPKLFEWPPATSPAMAIERASLLLLVGGAVFEFITGVLNIQYWYVFPASFYTLHFYGAWVFIAAFVVHVGLKLPRMLSALRSRSLRNELRTDTAHTEPEPPDPDHLASPDPAPATISRRGVVGLVGAGSLLLFVLTVGQSLGGVWRRTALLAPRSQDPGSGPNGFQVNKTAGEVGVTDAASDPGWQLELVTDADPVSLDRDQLLALPQHTAHLPIACVEGWSTNNQTWTGVRLRDLAAMAGAAEPESVFIESMEDGVFGSTSLRGRTAYGAYLPRARRPGWGPLRRSSRLMVDADRPTWVAMVRTPAPARSKSAICSRSSTLRYRPDGSGLLRGTCPPVAWRQRRPVRRSTPTASQAACSVEPDAMTSQNRACFSISSSSTTSTTPHIGRGVATTD